MRLSLVQLILAIMTIGVVVILLVAFKFGFNLAFAEELFGINTLSKDLEQQYEKNMTKIVANLEDCRDIQDNNCVCEIFGNLEDHFQHKFYMESKGRDMELSLKIGSKNYFPEIIENVYISVVIVERARLDFSKTDRIDTASKKWIDFSKNPPIFDNEYLGKNILTGAPEEPKFASSKVYKDDKGKIYLFLTEIRPEEARPFINTLRKCGDEKQE